MSGNLPFENVERDLIVRKESETSPKFGCDPYNRPVKELVDYGIVNINKPSGPTSHQVSAFVQNILKIDKSGHSGTLDPKVTGVLPVALGRATRIVNYLLTAGKEYVCLMHLHEDYEEYHIRKIISTFMGKIEQLPPIKSAVKRQLRTRKIYYLEIMEVIGRDVLFRVGCEAGTYIRKLCHDIGQKLGSGAHMAQLIRSKAGPFKLNKSWYLQDLIDAFHYYNQEKNDKFIRKVILPIEEGVKHLPKLWVMDTAIDPLCHGSDLALPGIVKLHSNISEGMTVAIMSLKEELIGIGTARMNANDLLGEKGIGIKTEKIFMLPGVYPKYSR